MFMRLYFRIIFFTSYYCLSSFIINYLGYLVFLSCSSYVPKLKVTRIHEMAPFINFLPERVTQLPSATIRIQPRPSLQAPRGTRWNPAFWSLGFGWEIFWELVFAMAVILSKMLTSDQIYPPPTGQKLSCFVLKEWEATALRWHMSDSVSCPVHTSVLADQTELLFSSSTGSGLKMACLHNISLCHLP